VRLIQRFGRIDRIGSEHAVVYGFNFLPETGIEKNLGLRQKLHNRIQEIHNTIGEDSAILDRTEQLNEEAMYAIYEKQGNLQDLPATRDYFYQFRNRTKHTEGTFFWTQMMYNDVLGSQFERSNQLWPC
jgi:hypothetical protein